VAASPSHPGWMQQPYSALPNSTVRGVNRIEYAYRDTGGAAHGFLFQHHAEFAADVIRFLA
jgi:hypothetical protein